MRPRNYFDIETGPWSGAKPFDWSTVKLGNLKDPDKIKAKRAEAAREYKDKLALSAIASLKAVKRKSSSNSYLGYKMPYKPANKL
jgi:hypothetical protein